MRTRPFRWRSNCTVKRSTPVSRRPRERPLTITFSVLSVLIDLTHQPAFPVRLENAEQGRNKTDNRPFTIKTTQDFNNQMYLVMIRKTKGVLSIVMLSMKQVISIHGGNASPW